MINKPLNHKEPHTYKDLCTKKYTTVPNHDGSVPGEKPMKKKGMTKKAKPMRMKRKGY